MGDTINVDFPLDKGYEKFLDVRAYKAISLSA